MFAEELQVRPARAFDESWGMKVRDVMILLRDNGWIEVARRGSHRQFKHPTRKGRVTVPGKPSDDLAAGTLNSILNQPGLKE